MKILIIIASIVLILLAVIVIVLATNGLFAPVNIKEQKTGPYVIVFQKHVGPYNEVKEPMDEVFYYLKENHRLNPTKGFGIYYDNPQKVESENLRSIVGCIIETESAENLRKMGIDYEIAEIPKGKTAYVDFPFKGTLSIIIGSIRVYPKLGKYIEDHDDVDPSAMMEIYDVPDKRLRYLAFEESKDFNFMDLLK